MDSQKFAEKLDDLRTEIEDEAVEEGREPDFLEVLTAMYERVFGEKVPTFENNLPEYAKAKAIHECFERQQKFSELTPLQFLQLQYECRFGTSLTYGFMTPFENEEQLTTALRSCIEKGVSYEISEEVKSLLEQGAVF